MAFTLPALPYATDALEPHIDAKTMEIHHGKHHAAYVAKLNEALQKAPSFQNKVVEEILRSLDSAPADVRTALRNHGGGHFSHSLFWNTLGPGGGRSPAGALESAISAAFGSFDKFKEQFSAAAAGLFGSGWAWLCADASRKLSIVALPNQDSPLSQGLKPILGLDVWEHAYYLKYQNRRPDYIAAFWNVVAWNKVAENLDRAY
jgi:Fe-Mn family superoxide dismutase